MVDDRGIYIGAGAERMKLTNVQFASAPHDYWGGDGTSVDALEVAGVKIPILSTEEAEKVTCKCEELKQYVLEVDGEVIVEDLCPLCEGPNRLSVQTEKLNEAASDILSRVGDSIGRSGPLITTSPDTLEMWRKGLGLSEKMMAAGDSTLDAFSLLPKEKWLVDVDTIKVRSAFPTTYLDKPIKDTYGAKVYEYLVKQTDKYDEMRKLIDKGEKEE